MIVNRECAERGCMAYDDRVDGPGEWVRTEWQGLTDEEASAVNFPEQGICYVYPSDWEDVGLPFVRAIEAKLKHKNTVRMRRATRAEKIVNPGVYWVEDKE